MIYANKIINMSIKCTTIKYLTRSMCGAALLLEQIKRSNECVRKDRNWESMKDQAASDED